MTRRDFLQGVATVAAPKNLMAANLETCPLSHSQVPTILGNMRTVLFNSNGNPAMYDDAITPKTLRSCATCGIVYAR